mgnify:FL=1
MKRKIIDPWLNGEMRWGTAAGDEVRRMTEELDKMIVSQEKGLLTAIAQGVQI